MPRQGDRGSPDDDCGRDSHGRALGHHGDHAGRADRGSGFREPVGARSAAADPADQRLRGERGGRCPQGRTRAIQQSPHRAVRDPEHVRHLFVGASCDGAQKDRVALHVREIGDIGERLAHGDPLIDVGAARYCDTRGHHVCQLLVLLRAGAHGVDGGVVDDAVEPRLQLAHLGPSPKGKPRVQKGMLQDVLGAGVREPHATAVAQQRPPVAVDQRLKGPLVTFARQRQQPIVRLADQ
jgi:hypothetical protein